MGIIRYLIVDQYGSMVAKHSERIRVVKGKERLAEAPLLHLEAILVTTNGVAISSDAIRECTERGIPIYFLSGRGKPYASIYSQALTGTIATRRAQLMAYNDGRGVVLAKQFVSGKLRNQANLLRYMAKYRKEREPEIFEAIQILVPDILGLEAEIESVEGESVDAVRERLLNIEGRAAQHYWAGIQILLKANLDWPGRRTRGASDPFNMTLNYAYGVLYGQIERALVLAGLDPYAGFLHADRPGKPSLSLDLIEEFRQQVVDRTMVGMVNKGVKIELDESKHLTMEFRRRIAEAVLGRLESRVPYEGKRFSLQSVIQSQARHMATFLRGERDGYEPFVGSW